MNLETKITIYKFTPQLFTLTRYNDLTLRNDLKDNPEGMLALVNKYFHCG